MTMYSIHSIVWGIIITKEVYDTFCVRQEKDEELPATLSINDGGWFETLYSGSASHDIGYIGICVCEYPTFDPPTIDEIERKKELITQEEKQSIVEEIDRLPYWLKKVVPDPNWHIVWSTS
jgi:hypothetical protein